MDREDGAEQETETRPQTPRLPGAIAPGAAEHLPSGDYVEV